MELYIYTAVSWRHSNVQSMPVWLNIWGFSNGLIVVVECGMADGEVVGVGQDRWLLILFLCF